MSQSKEDQNTALNKMIELAQSVESVDSVVSNNLKHQIKYLKPSNIMEYLEILTAAVCVVAKVVSNNALVQNLLKHDVKALEKRVYELEQQLTAHTKPPQYGAFVDLKTNEMYKD